MGLYRYQNCIFINDDNVDGKNYPFTVQQLEQMLEDASIYQFLYYGFGLFGQVDFVINGVKKSVSYDDFCCQLEKDPSRNYDKFLNIKELYQRNKNHGTEGIISEILEDHFGGLTGQDVMDIFKSNEPLRMCDEKNITFSDFFSIISAPPFCLPKKSSIKKDEDSIRCNFYYCFQSTLPLIWAFQNFTTDMTVLEKRLQEFGLSFEEYVIFLNILILGDNEDRFLQGINILKEFGRQYTQMLDLCRGFYHISEQNCLKKYDISFAVKEKFSDELEELAKAYSLSDTQKAYYLYRRVCQKFSYDDEFFSQRGKSHNILHGDFSRLKEVDFSNNLLVCDEAAFIYAKLCKDLIGVDVSLSSSDNIPWTYIGRSYVHAYVLLRTSDYIITADPVKGAVRGDLSREKNGASVRGFMCVNADDTLHDSFGEQLKVVDKILDGREKDYISYDTVSLLNSDSLGTSLDYEEAFVNSLKKIYNMPGNVMDKVMAYEKIAKELKSLGFEILFCVVDDLAPVDSNKLSTVGIIIGIISRWKNNVYYIKQGVGILSVTGDEVTKMVETGEMVMRKGMLVK